jgi:hypothetical protein
MAEALNRLAPGRVYSANTIYMWETGRRNPDPYSTSAYEQLERQLLSRPHVRLDDRTTRRYSGTTTTLDQADEAVRETRDRIRELNIGRVLSEQVFSTIVEIRIEAAESDDQKITLWRWEVITEQYGDDAD